MKQVWRAMCLILSASGLLLSIYLYTLSANSYCPTSLPGCDIVITSEYAEVAGIPLALMGAVWFAVAGALSLFSFIRKLAAKILLWWSLTSVPSVTALVAVEVLLIGAICSLCTLAHVLGLSLILPSYKLLR